MFGSRRGKNAFATAAKSRTEDKVSIVPSVYGNMTIILPDILYENYPGHT